MLIIKKMIFKKNNEIKFSKTYIKSLIYNINRKLKSDIKEIFNYHKVCIQCI